MEIIFLTVLTAIGLLLALLLGIGVLRALWETASGRGSSVSLPLVVAATVCLALAFVEPGGGDRARLALDARGADRVSFEFFLRDPDALSCG